MHIKCIVKLEIKGGNSTKEAKLCFLLWKTEGAIVLFVSMWIIS